MFPLMICLLGVSFAALQLSVMVPQSVAFRHSTEAEVVATQFLLYRKAALAYRSANPGRTGSVADALLPLPLGFANTRGWSNITDASGTLFVFSGAALPVSALDAIVRHGGSTLPFGVVTATGQVTRLGQQWAVPANIAIGAAVTTDR